MWPIAIAFASGLVAAWCGALARHRFARSRRRQEEAGSAIDELTGAAHRLQLETTDVAEEQPPTWSSWRDVPDVVRHRPHLRRTLVTAVVVGTLLFVINQLDVVLRGDATLATWVKGGVTYVVPFVVSNVGILIAARRPAA